MLNVGTNLIQKQGAMPKTGHPSKGLVIRAFTLLYAFLIDYSLECIL